MGFEEFARFYRPILNFTEEDFFNLLSILRKPLPSTLRITNTPFKERVENRLSRIKKSKYFTNVYQAPRQTIPNRGFIVNQTRAGNIQRQEIVSMLPVLLMGMKEDYSVLDMCAAPGSKTKQLLELINENGLVVCNEISFNRMRILVSETCKIPRKGFMVLRHDATTLPVFKNDFDRVLCDVPCSGDGTSRKNYDVVPKWTVDHALSLCELQFTILKHALEFIHDDGMVIYSTCSLNPIENECIVQKAVTELDLEIVDLRDNINEEYMSKEFKLRNGLTTWTMDIKEHNGISFEPISEDIGLYKCVRVFPHDQNTGGFFITGLRKRKRSGAKTTAVESNKRVDEKNLSSDSPIIDPEIKYNDIENKVTDIENKINNLEIGKVEVSEEEPSELEEEAVLPGFYEVQGELKEALEKEYNNENKILIQKRKGATYIYEVSKEVSDILKNKDLNVAYHGYKLFEKNTVNDSGYMIKTITEKPENMPHDLEITGDQLSEGVTSNKIQCEYNKGSVIVLLKDFNILVSGYSHGDHVTLNIGNRLQKAIRDYIRK